MDLVGHDVSIPIPGGDTLADLLFVTGAESQPDMEALVRPRVAADGLRIVASVNRYAGDMSDHYVLHTNDVPTCSSSGT